MLNGMKLKCIFDNCPICCEIKQYYVIFKCNKKHYLCTECYEKCNKCYYRCEDIKIYSDLYIYAISYSSFRLLCNPNAPF